MLYCISGPSGVGKTTISRRLEIKKGFRRVITSTTRPKRIGEEHGIDYHFLHRADFERLAKAGDFLLVKNIENNLYGIRKSETALAETSPVPHLVVLTLDHANAIRSRSMKTKVIALLPLDWRTLLLHRHIGKSAMTKHDQNSQSFWRNLECDYIIDKTILTIENHLDDAAIAVQDYISSLMAASKQPR